MYTCISIYIYIYVFICIFAHWMYLDKRRWTCSWWIDSTQGWPRWVTASCRQISIFQHLYIGRQPDNFKNNMGSQISYSNMILMQEQWDTSNVFHFLKLLTWKCRDFPFPGLVGKYHAGPQENPTPTAYAIFCELCLLSSFSQLGCSSNSFCHGPQTMSSCAGWQVIVRKKNWGFSTTYPVGGRWFKRPQQKSPTKIHCLSTSPIHIPNLLYTKK